jgi:hypothetical protein
MSDLQVSPKHANNKSLKVSTLKSSGSLPRVAKPAVKVHDSPG